MSPRARWSSCRWPYPEKEVKEVADRREKRCDTTCLRLLTTRGLVPIDMICEAL